MLSCFLIGNHSYLLSQVYFSGSWFNGQCVPLWRRCAPIHSGDLFMRLTFIFFRQDIFLGLLRSNLIIVLLWYISPFYSFYVGLFLQAYLVKIKHKVVNLRPITMLALRKNWWNESCTLKVNFMPQQQKPNLHHGQATRKAVFRRVFGFLFW